MRRIIVVLAAAAVLAAIAPALADPRSSEDCIREKELSSTADSYKRLLENFESSNIEAEQNTYLARFDSEKTLTLSGTVEEFHWTSPRAGIVLNVPNGEAQLAAWVIEMISPSGLVRLGWRSTTLTLGMPISVTIHPLRDGSNGGQLLTATLPDGRQMDGGRSITLQTLRDQAAAADRAIAEFRHRSGCDR